MVQCYCLFIEYLNSFLIYFEFYCSLLYNNASDLSCLLGVSSKAVCILKQLYSVHLDGDRIIIMLESVKRSWASAQEKRERAYMLFGLSYPTVY